jgi:HEAT repeat protein
MEQNIQIFLEKLQKRCTSRDAAKRVKCIQEIHKRMQISEECIIDGMEFLIRLLKDDDPWVRKESLVAMEAIVAVVMEQIAEDTEFKVKYQEKMVPVKKLLFYQAIQLTKDPDPTIRLMAVKIAGEKSLEYPLIREKATPFLMAKVKDEHTDVRNAAIGYIVRIAHKDPELAKPFLIRLYQGNKRPTDVYVTYILDKLMAKHHMPEFIPMLFGKIDDADTNTEKYIISALIKSGNHDLEALAPYLTEGLTDQSDMLWWVAARNMMLILTGIAQEHPEAVRPYLRYLIPHLTSENREIRKHTAEIMGHIGAGHPDRVKEGLAELISLVHDPDDLVKTTTLHSLEMIGIHENDHELVSEASIALNKARLVVMDLKKRNDLTSKIKDSYILARNAFTDGDYSTSLEFSRAAIFASKARTELRSHASDAIRSVGDILGDVLDTGGAGGSSHSIMEKVDRARRAFEDRKYFLAHELIYASKQEAGLVGQIDPLGDPYDLDPGMESRIDTMVCHSCGEKIAKGNTACPGCGIPLETTSCQTCGKAVPQGFQFCAGCGAHLDHVCEVCGAINGQASTSCEACGGRLEQTMNSNHSMGSSPFELDVEMIPRDR